MLKVTGIRKGELGNAIDHMEKFRYAHFMRTPEAEEEKRAAETENTKAWEFAVNGNPAVASFTVDCSGSHFLVRKEVVVAGVPRVRPVKYLKKLYANYYPLPNTAEPAAPAADPAAAAPELEWGEEQEKVKAAPKARKAKKAKKTKAAVA